MLMQAAPRQVDLDEIRKLLESEAEVTEVEDLHVWSASTTETLMTARLRCPQLASTAHDHLLARLHLRLKDDFDVSHATLEITHQVTPNAVCSLDDV
jgi:cobalt-zinc-cadmium efflux system protein